MRPKILIMDDEQDTLSMLSLTLKFSGFDVATADTGQKAIAMVGEYQPDAIILDVMMPDLTGIEVFKAIKQQSPDLPPVIFLSASIRPKDQTAGMEAGAYTYLVKPVSREKLIETVKAALASRGK
jgi:two-component system OmpR family response regulator